MKNDKAGERWLKKYEIKRKPRRNSKSAKNREAWDDYRLKGFYRKEK